MARDYQRFWSEYVARLQPHERPIMPGSPATPDHPTPLRLAYGAVGILISLTSNLGNAVVSTNLPNLQGALGATPVEAAWLPVIYVMTNASMGLLLIKFRMQYGLQLFTRIFLSALVVVSFANVLVHDLTSALVVRAVGGVAGSGLSTLGFLYIIQAFPAVHRRRGLVLGIGVASYAPPIARMITPTLLDIGGWRTVNLFELGLSILSLIAVLVLRLPPSERSKAFAPVDFLTFALFAPGVALLAAVLGLGRVVWWTQAPWIGWALAGAVVLLAGALAIEHNRRQPLINLRWLAGGDIVRLVISIMLVRVVLSEQTSGAVGFLQQMGLGPDQLRGLFAVILLATVAGSLTSALTLNLEKLNIPIAVALALIAAGAFLDSHATSQTRPANLFFSQALTAFAAALFIGPALMIGMSNVLRHGVQNIVSFIVFFTVGQNVGGLAGAALVGSVETIREKYHSSQLVAQMTLQDPEVALRLQQLGGAYGRVITDPSLRSAQALRLLAQQTTQQAHVLAYNDVFLMLSIAAALGALWVTAHYLRTRLAARAAEPAGSDAAGAAAPAVE